MYNNTTVYNIYIHLPPSVELYETSQKLLLKMFAINFCEVNSFSQILYFSLEKLYLYKNDELNCISFFFASPDNEMKFC